MESDSQLILEFYGKRQEYQVNINSISKRHWDRLTDTEKDRCRKQFDDWQRNVYMLAARRCYSNDGWRALYSEFLFQSRITTVLYSFHELVKLRPDSKDDLKAINSVVSIGCGPGPDIAAVLIVLRVEFRVRRPISVLAIDQYGEWKEYIDALRHVCYDQGSETIRFERKFVHEKSINGIENADLCVLSFTDAEMHTQRFWCYLKSKFRVILVLDVKNEKLARLMVLENYSMWEYDYLGRKRFFYKLPSKNIDLSRRPHSTRTQKVGRSSNVYNPSAGLRIMKTDAADIRECAASSEKISCKHKRKASFSTYLPEDSDQNHLRQATMMGSLSARHIPNQLSVTINNHSPKKRIVEVCESNNNQQSWNESVFQSGYFDALTPEYAPETRTVVITRPTSNAHPRSPRFRVYRRSGRKRQASDS